MVFPLFDSFLEGILPMILKEIQILAAKIFAMIYEYKNDTLGKQITFP